MGLADAIATRWSDLLREVKTLRTNKAFESRLFEPKSPFPGNGIFKPETKKPKRPRRFRDAVAETKSR
jgi:hypothetical protein